MAYCCRICNIRLVTVLRFEVEIEGVTGDSEIEKDTRKKRIDSSQSLLITSVIYILLSSFSMLNGSITREHEGQATTLF